jgi:hypothetical protein
MLIDPLLPLFESPVTTAMPPLTPELAVPVFNKIIPLTPFDPEFDVINDIEPLDDALPYPL